MGITLAAGSLTPFRHLAAYPSEASQICHECSG